MKVAKAMALGEFPNHEAVRDDFRFELSVLTSRRISDDLFQCHKMNAAPEARRFTNKKIGSIA